MNNFGFGLILMHVRDIGRFNSVTEAVLDPNHDIVEQVFSEPYLGESHQQRERRA
jgi:hypothetical protein